MDLHFGADALADLAQRATRGGLPAGLALRAHLSGETDATGALGAQIFVGPVSRTPPPTSVGWPGCAPGSAQ